MNNNDMIAAAAFCSSHHIEISFIRSLHEHGLLQTTWVEGEMYVPAQDLPLLEKMMRFHYDLDINFEGIESIFHLLEQVERLQHELMTLKNKMEFYENN